MAEEAPTHWNARHCFRSESEEQGRTAHLDVRLLAHGDEVQSHAHAVALDLTVAGSQMAEGHSSMTMTGDVAVPGGYVRRSPTHIGAKEMEEVAVSSHEGSIAAETGDGGGGGAAA